MVCSAGKPKSGAAEGRLVDLGSPQEWLRIGPFPCKDASKALDEQIIPNEAGLQPSAGEKALDLAWTNISMKGGYGASISWPWNGTNQAGYAATYLYAHEAGKATAFLLHDPWMRIWLNGKEVYSSPGNGNVWGPPSIPLDLVKGWNRLLFKVARADKNGWFQIKLAGSEYETKNVLWMLKQPAAANPWNANSPMIVGNNVFMNCPTTDTMCVDKMTGKIRWLKFATHFDAMPAEERKAYPKDKLDAIQAAQDKLEKLNVEIVKLCNEGVSPAGFGLSFHDGRDQAIQKKLGDKNELYKSIHAQLVALDKKYLPRNYDSCTPTICSDGKNIYVWFGIGIAVCYDMDGNRKWITPAHGIGCPEHGNHASAALSGGMFVCPGDICILGFDAKTGALAYRNKTGWNLSALGSMQPFVIGGEHCVLTAGGGGGSRVAAARADTGAFIWNDGPGAWHTPIVQDGVVYVVDSAHEGAHNFLYAFKIPDKAGGPFAKLYSVEYNFSAEIGPNAGSNPQGWGKMCLASPLFVDGLIYNFTEGAALSVSDAKTGQVVYKTRLDLHSRLDYSYHPGCTASPALGGKRVYIFDNCGGSLVLETGREYKQVARNVLENFFTNIMLDDEQFVSNPVFDGNRIYIPGREYLYCIGEK